MLNKISNRVYYMNYVQRGDRPVLGLVVGDECSLVIDGGNSREHAEEFLEYIKELKVPEVKYLVLTHWHWDHVWGVSTIDAINIVHRGTNKRLEWMRGLEWTDEAIRERVEKGEEIEFCEEHIKIAHPNSNRKIDIPKADITFDGFLEIDLGGVTVSVEHMNVDHSKDCCLVNVREENIVFMGDAMYLDMYNEDGKEYPSSDIWSYSREKLYPLLDKFISYNGEYYIPAHHPKYTKGEFNDFVMYIKEIGNIVGKASSLESAMENFEQINGRKPSEEEKGDLKAFVEGNKKRR